MSDSPPTPDDVVVSAVLDGVASPDEAHRVASDPRLAARLAEFRAVAQAVGGPVPLVDATVREAHLARALAEGVPIGSTAPTPPPPGDLAAARARRNRPRSTTILSVAAAVLLVVAAGTFLVRLGGSVDTGGDDSASSSDEARDSLSTESDGGADDGSGGAESFDTDDTEAATEAPASPSSTAPGEAGDAAGGQSGAEVDASLPDLGTFAKAEDLASRVRGELILEPSPADLNATQGFAERDTCLDDFGVEVILLGRATLEGQEGLVYVESAPGTGRRLWLVDPSTVGADRTCQEITPVQTL